MNDEDGEPSWENWPEHAHRALASEAVGMRLPQPDDLSYAAHVREASRLRQIWQEMPRRLQDYIATHAPDAVGINPGVPSDVRDHCNRWLARSRVTDGCQSDAPWLTAPFVLRNPEPTADGRHQGRIYGTQSPTADEITRVAVYVHHAGSPIAEAAAYRALSASLAPDHAALVVSLQTAPTAPLTQPITDLFMFAAADFPHKPVMVGCHAAAADVVTDVLQGYAAARQAHGVGMAPVSFAPLVTAVAGVSAPRAARSGSIGGLPRGRELGRRTLRQARRSPAPGMN